MVVIGAVDVDGDVSDDGGGGSSGVDGVEDVERTFNEGGGRVEIVVLLHRDPSAQFFFLIFSGSENGFGDGNGYPDLSSERGRGGEWRVQT